MVTKYIANREGLLRALAKAKFARVVDDFEGDVAGDDCELEADETETTTADDAAKNNVNGNAPATVPPTTVPAKRKDTAPFTVREGLFLEMRAS